MWVHRNLGSSRPPRERSSDYNSRAVAVNIRPHPNCTKARRGPLHVRRSSIALMGSLMGAKARRAVKARLSQLTGGGSGCQAPHICWLCGMSVPKAPSIPRPEPTMRGAGWPQWHADRAGCPRCAFCA